MALFHSSELVTGGEAARRLESAPLACEECGHVAEAGEHCFRMENTPHGMKFIFVCPDCGDSWALTPVGQAN